MVQRIKTAKEGWFGLIKLAYMLVAFPFALIIGGLSLFMAPSLITEGAYSTLFFFAVLWLGVLIPVGVFAYGVISRRRLLKSMVASLQSPDYFSPDASNEIYHEGDGKYFGIDTKHGTILYVHRIRKGQVDVLAMTMDDWTNREVEGRLFRLYTKLPELPRIQVATPLAQRWYDMLGAMEHKQFSTAPSFKQHVRGRLDELEREHSVQIPRLA